MSIESVRGETDRRASAALAPRSLLAPGFATGVLGGIAMAAWTVLSATRGEASESHA